MSARGARPLGRRTKRRCAWLAAATALLAVGANAWARPFPRTGDVAALDLIADRDPALHAAIRLWRHAAPGVAALLAWSVAVAGVRVWAARSGSRARAAELPPWPTAPTDAAPSVVVGELHHPVRATESARPSWLVVPEKGLYTGVLVVGAVGTGKTTACMRPFAQQLLSWQADRPDLRAGALVLEVKGDFCRQVRRILADCGRGDDYVGIGLGRRWRWNPLDDPETDAYSLAYGVASLVNQLFGKGRDPFWQQAYTNLVRWIVELHRLLPDEWVTLQDVYRCAIDGERLARRIERARERARRFARDRVAIAAADLAARPRALRAWTWRLRACEGGEAEATCRLDDALEARLGELGLAYRREKDDSAALREFGERVAAVERWYAHDWTKLDAKLRTSIVEGISVFLSLFDQPDVARVFCPPAPKERKAGGQAEAGEAPAGPADERQRVRGLVRDLPPLAQLIEEGRVLALDMPAGANPALARAVGVMLKNAWLQALLRRPARAARPGDAPMRPAVFVCDEYQAFATVGQDDPAGDEKAFALTRQCRCIPIVATQSISSLRSALPGDDAWRALVQTLRTRVFLALSDVASARIASEMCGAVLKTQPSYTLTETTGRPEFSLLSGRAGGGRGTIGASKSFRQGREPVFGPRDFSLLANYQAICLPYDGAQSLPATRVYLKPHYLPRMESHWRHREEGRV